MNWPQKLLPICLFLLLAYPIANGMMGKEEEESANVAGTTGQGGVEGEPSGSDNVQGEHQKDKAKIEGDGHGTRSSYNSPNSSPEAAETAKKDKKEEAMIGGENEDQKHSGQSPPEKSLLDEDPSTPIEHHSNSGIFPEGAEDATRLGSTGGSSRSSSSSSSSSSRSASPSRHGSADDEAGIPNEGVLNAAQETGESPFAGEEEDGKMKTAEGIETGEEGDGYRSDRGEGDREMDTIGNLNDAAEVPTEPESDGIGGSGFAGQEEEAIGRSAIGGELQAHGGARAIGENGEEVFGEPGVFDMGYPAIQPDHRPLGSETSFVDDEPEQPLKRQRQKSNRDLAASIGAEGAASSTGGHHHHHDGAVPEPEKNLLESQKSLSKSNSKNGSPEAAGSIVEGGPAGHDHHLHKSSSGVGLAAASKPDHQHKHSSSTDSGSEGSQGKNNKAGGGHKKTGSTSGSESDGSKHGEIHSSTIIHFISSKKETDGSSHNAKHDPHHGAEHNVPEDLHKLNEKMDETIRELAKYYHMNIEKHGQHEAHGKEKHGEYPIDATKAAEVVEKAIEEIDEHRVGGPCVKQCLAWKEAQAHLYNWLVFIFVLKEFEAQEEANKHNKEHKKSDNFKEFAKIAVRPIIKKEKKDKHEMQIGVIFGHLKTAKHGMWPPMEVENIQACRAVNSYASHCVKSEQERKKKGTTPAEKAKVKKAAKEHTEAHSHLQGIYEHDKEALAGLKADFHDPKHRQTKGAFYEVWFQKARDIFMKRQLHEANPHRRHKPKQHQ